MHVTITRTKDPHGQPMDYATIAAEEMARWLRTIDGFKGLLMLTNEEERETVVISFWESREVAEEHREARTRLREHVTATVNVEVQDVTDYDLAFAELPRGLFETLDLGPQDPSVVDEA
jgi:heme-degrading monooxygenase HmoA